MDYGCDKLMRSNCLYQMTTHNLLLHIKRRHSIDAALGHVQEALD